MSKPLLSLLATSAISAAFTTLPLLGCSSPPSSSEAGAADDDFSSREAVLLDFELDGELVSDDNFALKAKVQDQFLYTIGHLNGDRSVGRLDKLALTNLQATAQPDGTYRVTYHAKLPVAWGRRTRVPATYAFTVPKTVTWSGLEAFTNKYKDKCADWSAHDVTSGNMWYYYRPRRGGCALDPAEVVSLTTTVAPSANNTSGKYPEYQKVWEDDELQVVSIFGKFEEGATTSADAGISAYEEFVRSMKRTLGPLQLTTDPPNVSDTPGVAAPVVTFHAQLADGKKVTVTSILVDNVSTAGADFTVRYEPLSSTADVVMYNGHAGLGQNVRSLANRGTWVAGKYLVLFMNGCDSFAYVDGSLAQKRAPLNPDDTPDGTKYLDIVTNAMPSYFASDSEASTALIQGLLSVGQPKTYEQMFAQIDTAQVVLVTGEEDNVFQPGMPLGAVPPPPPPPPPEYSRDVAGSLDRGQEITYDTPELPARMYRVSLVPDPAHPSADADLYVKVGGAPTDASYDCRPYLSAAQEEDCLIALAAPAKIYARVVGYEAGATSYKLSIRAVAPPPANAWQGMEESGALAKGEEKRFETPTLAAGTYTFVLSGMGDVDLYVKQGAEPTTSSYDCRPYQADSDETCTVTLAKDAAIHVLLHGWAPSSTFTLIGRP